MNVYNYENITYEVTGMSAINDPKDTKQEGILFHFRAVNFKETAPIFQKLDMFIDKRDLAHISVMIKTGRKFWKRFRLPKMIEQKSSDLNRAFQLPRVILQRAGGKRRIKKK